MKPFDDLIDEIIAEDQPEVDNNYNTTFVIPNQFDQFKQFMQVMH